MGDEDRWEKLERIVRRVIREEIAALGKKNKVEFVNGKWLGITDQLMQAWSSAYPSVDIPAELLKAAAWILSNPTLAPKSQFSRFLLTWFSRTQDRSSIRSIPTRSEMQSISPTKNKCSYCDKPARHAPNRTPACDEHFQAAMDHEPVRAA